MRVFANTCPTLVEKTLRLTRKTNLALRVLMCCAVNTDRRVRTSDLSGLCICSVNHGAHVVQELQAAGYVSTARGRGGGLQLARPGDRISIGAVFRDFEDNIPFTECVDAEKNTCPLVGSCRLRDFVGRALAAFYDELDRATLDDLVRGNCGLDALLALGGTLGRACPAQGPSQPETGNHDP